MRRNYQRFSRKAYAARLTDVADELEHWYRIYASDANVTPRSDAYDSRVALAAQRRDELLQVVLHLREAAAAVYALD